MPMQAKREGGPIIKIISNSGLEGGCVEYEYFYGKPISSGKRKCIYHTY